MLEWSDAYLSEVSGYQMQGCGVRCSSLDVAGQQASAWLPLLCLRILPGRILAVKHNHRAQKSSVHFSIAVGRV